MNPYSMGFISHHFLLLNGVVVILLIVSFARMRRPRGRRSPLRVEETIETKTLRPRAGVEVTTEAGRVTEFKSLNVMFNYNGHSWDAYEVLGIPAGSSYEAAIQAFEKIGKSLDDESKKFFQTAIEAIRIQKSS